MRQTEAAGARPGVWRMVMDLFRAMHGPAPSCPVDPSTRYETREVNAKWVAVTGAGLLVAVWLVVLLVYPVFGYLRRETPRMPGRVVSQQHFNVMPPEPRIQADPRTDLQDFRAWEEKQLKSYFWVDRAHNVVSIPIDQAMKIIAQRGIPPRTAGAGQTYFDPRAGTRQTGFEGKVEPEPR
jgi:hypothetical protein